MNLVSWHQIGGYLFIHSRMFRISLRKVYGIMCILVGKYRICVNNLIGKIFLSYPVRKF